METFEKFIGRSRNVGERDPGVFVGREIFPAHEVLVALSDLAAVEDGVNVQGGIGIFGKDERSGRRMRVKVRWVMVGFEKGNMEYGIETG